MALKPQTQRDQAMIAVAVVSVLLAVVYFMYVYTPKSEELVLVETHVAALDSANTKAKRALAKGSVDELRAEAARSAQSLELMRQLVPTGNEVPALLEQVSTAARRVGLDIASVTPEPVVAGDQFDTYRYRMRVIGGYHAVGEFLTNVGSLTRIIAPVNLKLEPASGPALAGRANNDASTLKTEFEIQTYVARAALTPADAQRSQPIPEPKS